jgi:peroxiredoxin Q/BCP
MITPGQKPDLHFPVSYILNGEERTAPFASLLNGKTVVAVHMKNGSPSCDKQTESQVAAAAELAALGYALVGLSADSCASHRKYAAKKNAGYPLVSDPDGLFAKATDSLVEKSMYGKTYVAPARIALVFDASGTVTHVLDNVTAKDFGPELVKVLSAPA